MKIELFERKKATKGSLSKVRREGFIPGVLYGKTLKESAPIMIKESEFKACIRALKAGSLATEQFHTKWNGKECSLLVKEVQYHRISYEVEHIDFLLLSGDVVEVNVPVFPENEDRCIGITQGGMLKRIKRSVKVKAKPQDLPKEFTIDISNIALGQRVVVGDLSTSENVIICDRKHQVLLSVGK